MPDETTLSAIARGKPISAARAQALVDELAEAHKVVEAARYVVNEVQRTHDTEPWPIKYGTPYGAIVKLIEALEGYDHAHL